MRRHVSALLIAGMAAGTTACDPFWSISAVIPIHATVDTACVRRSLRAAIAGPELTATKGLDSAGHYRGTLFLTGTEIQFGVVPYEDGTTLLRARAGGTVPPRDDSLRLIDTALTHLRDAVAEACSDPGTRGTPALNRSMTR
ncbi:MAG TPA: hypothetical protein VG940_10125 [Gemmatimonadales bacterium]|nr:hypothetical protein [Gemmatimonadales bacterium]